MKHPSTRELFDYWNNRRGSRPAPERSEIEPGAIRRVLADTFILGIDPGSGHPFRIAGTRVCAIFGRELKGMAFTDLWRETSRSAASRFGTSEPAFWCAGGMRAGRMPAARMAAGLAHRACVNVKGCTFRRNRRASAFSMFRPSFLGSLPRSASSTW